MTPVAGARSWLPRLLIALGLVLMVAGLAASVALLMVQERCQHTQPGEYSEIAAACSKYQNGAEWGYLLVALGAVTIVAGSLTSTASVQRTGRSPSAE